MNSPSEAILQTALVAGVYVCLGIHELAHFVVAQWLGLRMRDLTLYPIGGHSRLAEMGERPWKEPWVAAAGPVAHGLIAGLIGAVQVALGIPFTPHFDSPLPFAETLVNQLFWLNVLMAVFQVIPAFPMDGGRIFRGALAQSVGRLRATEVAAMLSSFVALFVLIPGMLWMSSVWWLIGLGIVIHVSGQQELMSVRYYTSLQEPTPGTLLGSPLSVPLEQLLDDDARPTEPDFNGLIWNPKNRLWIVWRNGEPVSANALVGE